MKPPVPLKTQEESCNCADQEIPGIFWTRDNPALPDEPGYQKVERCDECELYPNDATAARVVALLHGFKAVVLEDRPWDDRGICYAVHNPDAPKEPPPPRPCDLPSPVDTLQFPLLGDDLEQTFWVRFEWPITVAGRIENRAQLFDALAENLRDHPLMTGESCSVGELAEELFVYLIDDPVKSSLPPAPGDVPEGNNDA